MKKITIILIAILLVILVIALINNISISSKSGLETKESSAGSVSVAVMPRSLEESSATWDFEIKLNTHSEELSEDLVIVSELVDDQGRVHKPISWEGDPPGGHHRQGVLKFKPILPRPKSIELKMSKLSASEIKNAGGISERIFK